MSIATRKGDDGTTGLLYGQRVRKDHPQIEAVGAVDELNVAIGAIKPRLEPTARGESARTLLTTVQANLVAMMGELACAESDVARYDASPFEKVRTNDLRRLDDAIREIEAQPLKLDGWATPGANETAVAFDAARTTARRAERRIAGLPDHGRSVRPELRQYINRLSDLLWLLARQFEQ